MKILFNILFILLVVPQIWGQVNDFRPSETRSYSMVILGDTYLDGELEEQGHTVVVGSDNHLTVVFVDDNMSSELIFQGTVKFIGWEKKTGNEIYLHQSRGLIQSLIVNWSNNYVVVEDEGVDEPYFKAGSLYLVPPPAVKIPNGYKPLDSLKLERL